MAHGMSRGEAERRARLELGGVQQLKESLHDQRSVPWLDHLRQDVRYAIRTILRTKAVSAAVIVTFALGIGANTAIFSLINSVLLTPLPYDGADRIVAVEPFWTNTGRTTPVTSAPDFRDWRDQNQVLDYLAFHAGREIRVAVNGAPSFASVQLVTPDFFNVFGMVPVAGRMWTAAEDSEVAPLAVVNYEWAVARFGDARGALGQTVEALGRAAEIIGVASPGFRYPGSTEVWMPSTMIPINENRGGNNYFVVGRRKAGVTLDQARRDMRAIADRLAKDYPDNRFKSVAVTPMLEKLTGGAETTLWLLFATVIGVMLIACVNVAHLQLARAAARTREMSVRSAIGAAPGRIARQVLTENVVIGLAGSAVGLAVGWLTLRTFLATAPADIPRLNEVHVDMLRIVLIGVVIGLVIALAAVRTIQAMLFDINAHDPVTIAAVVALLMMTALVASGIPALRAASVDPIVALRDE
jgi:predicted permease